MIIFIIAIQKNYTKDNNRLIITYDLSELGKFLNSYALVTANIRAIHFTINILSHPLNLNHASIGYRFY